MLSGGANKTIAPNAQQVNLNQSVRNIQGATISSSDPELPASQCYA
jgi:hypothetical protein